MSGDWGAMPVLKNPKHEAFAQALAGGKTATQAYVLAGYRPNDGNAARLKGNERIAARIAEILSKAADRVEVSIADVMAELQKVAFSDIRKAVRWGETGLRREGAPDASQPAGTRLTLVSSDELDSDTAAAIAEVVQTPTGVRVKFHSKHAALVELAKLKLAAAESTPASKPGDGRDAPRSTGADHLAGLRTRYGHGWALIQGGAKPKLTGEED